MKSTIICMSMLLLGSFALDAQEKQVKEPERKIFVLKYADAQEVGNLLMKIFAGSVSFDRNMKVIAASGSPELISAVGEAIAKLDVPPQPVKNLELTAYLLVGSTKPEPGSALPPELDSVVKQIRTAFPYKGFELLDSIVVRAQASSPNGVALTGVAGAATAPAAPTYEFKFSSNTVTQENETNVIRLQKLYLSLRVPVPKTPGSDQYTYVSSGISTDVDFREGQKVVVGKSSYGSPDKALFLVLTGKVVD